MSHAHDDIRELHTKASGLSHNYRDASGGAGTTQTWQQKPTPIRTPANRPGSNPYSRRMTSSDAHPMESRAGSSSALKSLRPPPKRQKRDHPQENSVSKYFDEPSQRRGSRAIPSTSTSSHSNRRSTDAIIIDVEDDTAATNDHPHEPIQVRTSSPDPMDVISPEASYEFDQNKPSPISAFSSSLEEVRNPPGDGQSTLRVRNVMKVLDARTAVSHSRRDGDNDTRPTDALPTLLSRGESSAQAEASSGRGNVKEKVAIFEQNKSDNPPHYDLHKIRQTRKNGMKRKQSPSRRDIPPLPIQHLDFDATRPSGFTSGLKLSKGKATGSNNISLHLPLKEWAIGPAILPSQEATTQLLVQLVWESRVLKVRDANGSIPFELQVQKGSIESIKYVGVKRTTTSEPLVQIRPSVLANAQNRTAFEFKPGSSDPEGLLTFKFDTSASDWDNDVYLSLCEKLLESLNGKKGKSILDGPAARAVWEAVTRGNENTSTMSEPEPTALDVPKENPPYPPSKPRSRPKSSGNATATPDISRRRSARLSEVEEKRFSPKPDPDEVILGYRSGTGSLNITNGDVSRLKPGEFLNDTLIEFGLKLWLADLQESNPELASQVHVFSSFFYKKLSTRIPEEGYNSVRKWTSKFDLFKKKYIIVPINENLHWYLAIIYLPEYTLLPPPAAQVKNVPTRRSTRRLGVIIDPPDAQRPKLAPRRSPPLQVRPDPPQNGHADTVFSSVEPETPQTDDQRSEMDVERMVESTLTPVDPPSNQVDGQLQAGMANANTVVGQCPESPSLAYPHSSPTFHPATLLSLSSDPQGHDAEHADHVTTEGNNGDTIRTSGIPPTTFYGTKPQGQGDVTPVTPPRAVSSPLSEIEIDEDETVGNPESEPEEVSEHPKTYIYTFDSLASKHPQAVKRLSRYLLMEAHDKKQKTEDDLTEPKGMQAIVPDQPNYCDCGIYLLHFAKTFMKDPKLSSDIIQSRTSPRKGRAVPHEHWDHASVGNSRKALADRIRSMSEEWKKQRGEQDSGTKNQTDGGGGAPQEQQQQQPRGDPTPTVSSKAENDGSDSDVVVVGTPQKPPQTKASRRDSGLSESKKGPAARFRSQS